MKFPNLHIVWTEGKNLLFPDLLSRSLTTTTQDEHRLHTVEISNSVKFFMTHNQQLQPIQCHYAVSKEYINTVTADTAVETTHFPIYLQIKENNFQLQLENNLYLPVSYHEYKTNAQTVEHVHHHRTQKLIQK